jgi:hypothetical protein
LRNKDVGELFQDAQRLARRQPVAFVGAAFVLGLVGARFLKSSSRDERGDDGGDSRGEYAAAPSFNQSSATGGAVSTSPEPYPSQYTGGGAGDTAGTSTPTIGSIGHADPASSVRPSSGTAASSTSSGRGRKATESERS